MIPCFSAYLSRAFSINRALRSWKESIRSRADLAKAGAEVSNVVDAPIWNIHLFKLIIFNLGRCLSIDGENYLSIFSIFFRKDHSLHCLSSGNRWCGKEFCSCMVQLDFLSRGFLFFRMHLEFFIKFQKIKYTLFSNNLKQVCVGVGREMN